MKRGAIDPQWACRARPDGMHRWKRIERGSEERVCFFCGARGALVGSRVLQPGQPTYYERSRRARGVPRARTIAIRSITHEELVAGAIETPLDVRRPRTRAECLGDERPCPWVSCKHHLYLDVNPITGSIKMNFPTLEPWELVESCSLDVADRGEHTLEEVGLLTNLTRERIRQVETRALIGIRFQTRLGKEAA